MTKETARPVGGASPRGPLHRIGLCALVLLGTTLAFLLAGRAIVDRQKEAFFAEKVRAGRLLANRFSESAVFPLLGEDAATLSNLVRDPSAGAGMLFLAVADADNVVRAHSDPSRIGEVLRIPPGAADHGTEDGVSRVDYPLSSGGRAIHLFRPLVLRKKIVGAAHVAFAYGTLQREAENAARPLRRALQGLAALSAVAIAGMGGLFVFRGGTAAVPSAPGRAAGAGNGSVYRVTAIDDEPAGDFEVPSSREEEAHTARPVLEPPSPPRIERNQATVLVSNVRGFRRYADGRRPEEILEGLGCYFGIAEDVVVSHGGRISHFSGDTVVGVFGGTSILPDHTNRAVRAALAMQKALREAAEAGRPLLAQVAIGISSGVILSCEGGRFPGSSPVMIGENFKSAEALAMMAGPGEIVIGKEVYQYLGSAVSVDPLPPREILDRTGSWENFRLQDDPGKRA